MIEIANHDLEKEDINFLVDDIRKFRTKETYDAVISLFHVMSYQNKNEDVLSAFISAREAVKKADYLSLMSGMNGSSK